jgi:hypothetical protein
MKLSLQVITAWGYPARIRIGRNQGLAIRRQ